MAIRPKDRFEVFKRDGFRCQYCGRKTPDVVLEVDHIIPRADGGSDEFENLLTACWDCNRGKGGRSLGDIAPIPNLAAETAAIWDREEQLREYHAAKEAEAERQTAMLADVLAYWFQTWGEDHLERWYIPWEATLRDYCDKLGVHEVRKAMDITGRKFDSYVSTNAVKYFVGVLRRSLAQQEGRIVECVICGETIVLTDQEVAESGLEGWHHTACKEPA
jgi:hypothetical protein